MRPYIVGSACHRVQEVLDHSLCDGTITLPPELAAHAERCLHCQPQVREVEALFQRLRSIPAGIDLGPVPGVVDQVLEGIAAAPSSPIGLSKKPEPSQPKRQPQFRWLLGQLAAVAAAILIAAGGLTYLALQVNHAVSGVKPSEVVQKWTAPLQDWTQALFRNTQ